MTCRRATLAALCLCLPAACSHSSSARRDPGAAPTSTPPTLRLPASVRPVRYALDLRLDPAKDKFTGTVDVDVAWDAPTSIIWLHARKLAISRVALAVGDQSIGARAVPAGKDFVGIALDSELPAGRGALHIEYEGTAPDDQTSGAFREKVGEDWYLFTQFEAAFARDAFPCFDEPGFKVPWQVKLHVRKELAAVSNTPVVSEVEEAGGLKVVTFAPTKPLPSYLVAFAVGPFEFVDAGKVPNPAGTPMRIVVPRGATSWATYAAKQGPQVLAHLESYFGIPYPYEKMDLVAVPNMPGAMENAGMITCMQSALLTKPEEESVSFRRGFTVGFAHEMGHQWFGDLVTMRWWDDLWLNEAFAEWVEYRVVEDWLPELHVFSDFAGERGWAMRSDSLASARKIRQPIETSDDIENAFDGITYGKGASIINMFEHSVGHDAFQKGVRDYLSGHAFGNATSADFLAAMDRSTGRSISGPFSTFLEQTGVPVVHAKLECDGKAEPRLLLSQRRFVPTGSKSAETQTWQLPVCVRWEIAKKEGRACTLLEGASGELKLAGATGCPDLLVVNDGGAGYFRTEYDVGEAGKLAKQLSRLTLLERLMVLDDAQALFASGKASASDALSLVPIALADPEPEVRIRGIRLAMIPRRMDLDTEELKPIYQRWLIKVLGPSARALGWAPKEGEPDAVHRLRPELIWALAYAGDATIRAEAAKQAQKWLTERRGIDPDVLEDALNAAARGGDKTLFDQVHAAMVSSTDATERERLQSMLASFEDPALFRRALDMLLTTEIRAQETLGMFRVTGANPNRAAYYEFYKKHFAELIGRIPKDMQAGVLYAGTQQCTAERRADLGKLIAPHASELAGGPRIMTQALETLDLCIAAKSVVQAGTAAFLQAN